MVLKGPPWRVLALWCSMTVGRSMRNVCNGHHAQTGRERHDSPHTERHRVGWGHPRGARLRGIEGDEPPYKFTLASVDIVRRTCHARSSRIRWHTGLAASDHVRRPNPTNSRPISPKRQPWFSSVEGPRWEWEGSFRLLIGSTTLSALVSFAAKSVLLCDQ